MSQSQAGPRPLMRWVGFAVAIAAAGCVMAGCATTPATPATAAATDVAVAARTADPVQAAMVGWWTGGGSDIAGTLQRDFAAITDASAQQDSPALGTACASLQRDARTAQAFKPIPDREAQASWARALSSAAKSGRDCISGTATQNASLIVKAGNELGDATDAINAVAQRIADLNAQITPSAG